LWRQSILIPEAIFEILANEGHITQTEVAERMKKLNSETLASLQSAN
jgi:hypothetical protein